MAWTKFRWEGGTLVSDTVGFNGLACYGAGLSFTESLRVVVEDIEEYVWAENNKDVEHLR